MDRALKYASKNLPRLDGKSFLITGASSGIGFECARMLLFLGAHVTFMVRNEDKAKSCLDKIKGQLGKEVDADIAIYDQSKPESIRLCIANLPERNYEAIVLNAGIYFPKKGTLGQNNNSLTLQTNAIGTQICFEEFLKRFPNSKYVFTTSVANSSPKDHDYAPYFRAGEFDRLKEYSLSKRIAMNIFLIAKEVGVRAYLTHPGVSRTNIINGYAPFFKRLGNGFLYIFTHPAWKAALGMLRLCALDYPVGTYLVPRGLYEITGYPKEREIPKEAYIDKENWTAFWEKEKQRYLS